MLGEAFYLQDSPEADRAQAKWVSGQRPFLATLPKVQLHRSQDDLGRLGEKGKGLGLILAWQWAEAGSEVWDVYVRQVGDCPSEKASSRLRQAGTRDKIPSCAPGILKGLRKPGSAS